MPKETEWQTRICKRLRDEGHFAHKWATQLQSGPPDLILYMQPTSVVYPERPAFHNRMPAIGALVEVKMERKWTGTTARTLKLTRNQHRYLDAYRNAGGAVGLLVVIEKWAERRYNLFQFVDVPPLQHGPPTVKLSTPRNLYEWHGPKTGPSLSNYLRRFLRDSRDA